MDFKMKHILIALALIGILIDNPSLAASASYIADVNRNAGEVDPTPAPAPVYGQPAGDSLSEPEAGSPTASTPTDAASPPETVTPQPLPSGTTYSAPAQSPYAAGIMPVRKPLVKPPQSLIDLSSAKFGGLDISLQNAEFREAAVDHADFHVEGADFGQGRLSALNIRFGRGRFEEFRFDQFMLSTAGDLNFDPQQLFDKRVLQFKSPAKAAVTAMVSQDSLNQFLGSQKVLDHLSISANKRLGVLASMLGAGPATLVLSIKNAQVTLAKNNKVIIAFNANLGMIGVSVPLAFEIDATLGVKDGWVDIADTHLITNGQEISPKLSEMLVHKIHSLVDWERNNDDIQFQFAEVKVTPGKQFVVKGSALINRLHLSKTNEAQSTQ